MRIFSVLRTGGLITCTITREVQVRGPNAMPTALRILYEQLRNENPCKSRWPSHQMQFNKYGEYFNE